MTNNPTIDGVSREDLDLVLTYGCGTDASDAAWDRLRALLDAPSNDLREHCKQCAEVVKTWPEWKQNCLGGAPAVEVQRVINRLESSDPDFNDCTDAVKVIRVLSAELKRLEINSQVRQIESNQLHEIISGPGDHHAAARRVYDAGYRKSDTEVAALHSTIAQLRQHKNDYMEAAEETRRALTDDVAQLQARIAELESGRDEPVAWMSRCIKGVREGVIEHVDGPDDVSNLEYWSRAFPVYTAPPAPVAVVLPERMPGPVDTDSHEEGWNACLDATAALNEGRK